MRTGSADCSLLKYIHLALLEKLLLFFSKEKKIKELEFFFGTGQLKNVLMKQNTSLGFKNYFCIRRWWHVILFLCVLFDGVAWLSYWSKLCRVQTGYGISSANVLLQAAEAALPKQKKALAVSEFKHAAVAYKRRSKSQQVEGENAS